MTPSVRFNSCNGCALGCIEVGAEWVAAFEAVTSLSGVYPKEADGTLKVLDDTELETIRENEVRQWSQVEGIGRVVADYLIRVPQVVKANYECDKRIAAGECSLQQQVILKEN